ncbi:type II toxin-antitoxin system VapB family antitoxin [Rhodoplanes azumiensis]|uniref:Type II toxin-antitoxin system VapB family antitoxin n=1 Tax=Rhodoplanes azumiensis TaxID=1897628 RepID=A0ABW5APD9_9BRAD
MGLNIDTEEALRLAEELARITGESLPDAVTTALRERLERVRPQDGRGLSERLMAIGRDCAAHMSEPWKSMDPDEFLYDENGLPK